MLPNPHTSLPIVEAMLYEGYVLYPYRSAALKNRQRWNFGVRYPDSCMDLQAAGDRSWIALIESIEQDYDEQVHLAVVLEEDPGKDLGWLRQPGHRFFFSIEEVEPLEKDDCR